MRAKRQAVVISRQMGSGGSYIGLAVAKELGFRYVDREILREAAQRLATDEELLMDREERPAGIIQNLLRTISLGVPDAYIVPMGRPVYNKDLYVLERTIMNDIVDHYSAVIMGRGGYLALKDRPEVVSVFIHAGLEFRIKRVMDTMNITDPKKARGKVEESDRRRVRFARDILGVNWTDARNFHLSIDSGVTGFAASAEMIVRLVHEKGRSA
ncbi:MAG: cytidylate kinase-like family protein [Syntrophorhabdales bacterium]|jgi:cytidylate kinase